MRERGVFISFEGIEGGGKSTQAKLLSDYLKKKGIGTVLTAEPGGTKIGRKIRDILLSIDHGEMDPLTELLLYAASRRQHIVELILPALDKGIVVITDRFSDSTTAYQGYGRGIDLKLIDAIDIAATGRLKPDVTVLFDIDVEAGLMRNRSINKIDRLELEDIEFHKRVREGYLALREDAPDKIKLIDASGSAEEIHKAVLNAVGECLAKGGFAL